MRKGWEIKPLKDIAAFSQGIQVGLEKHETKQKEGYVRFIRIIDYTQNTEDIRYIPNPGEKYYVNEDDIVMVRYGSPGLVGRGKAGVIANNLFKITILRNDITNDYLTHFLSQDNIQKYLSSQGASTMPALNFGQLGKIEISFPININQQQEIVSILDGAFESIERAKLNAEKNLKNAKELFESHLKNIFNTNQAGWISSTIGETCNLQTGGTPSTSKKEYYDGGLIKWLVSGDINQKVIDDCEGRITEVGMKNSNTKYLPVNSVLIALNGQGKTRGTVAMLRTKATCNQSLVSIFPKNEKELLPELVFSNLEGRYEEIRKMTGDSGNDRRGLNMPLIRSIKFSYPKSISTQKEVIKKLDLLRSEIKKLEFVYQQKLNDLEELKKSILQKAFNGELKTSKISA
jgi:type I restriction enzyme S subunit